MMGVYQIIGNDDLYKKRDNEYVVPNEKYVILRYLVLSSSTCNSIEWLDNELNQMSNKGAPKKGMKRLFKEFNLVKNMGHGIQIQLNDQHNLTIWDVSMTNFDKNSNIYKDMMEKNITSIKFQVLFTDRFPFNPPFIRVVEPVFIPQTAHITRNGAICMELLTPQNWSQVSSLENILIQIKTLVVEGGGRIQSNNKYGTLEEAKMSFNQVAKSHGWM